MAGAADVVILIGGPTASGKSGLALDLAERFDGIVINADSMQVYSDLRVLTARPGPAEEARAPHRLYGVLDAAERCSAGRWRDLAAREISNAEAAGRLPILVGGTGLYFRALLKGLAPVPQIPAEMRVEAIALHDEMGGARFHRLLAQRDPEGAGRLRPSDTQRLIRAFEVLEATGRPLSEWLHDQPEGEMLKGRVLPLVVDPPRDAVYAACNSRAEAMVAGGALDEVRALLSRNLDPSLPAMRALGVRELATHLRGELDRAGAVRLLQQATRRYAKRQVTWFRHQMPDAKRISCPTRDAATQRGEALVREVLLTGSG